MFYIYYEYLVDVGARNERRLCAIFYGKTPGFEVRYYLLMWFDFLRRLFMAYLIELWKF